MDEIYDQILKICQQIIQMAHPDKIILYNMKSSLSGELSSFKLCIILPSEDKMALEKQIYLTVDSDIPFDVLIYTTEEFDSLKNQSGSFAHKVAHSGKVLHG